MNRLARQPSVTHSRRSRRFLVISDLNPREWTLYSLQRLTVAWAALFLALLLSACSGTQVETPTPQRISIAGSTSAQPLLLTLTSAYHQQHPHISFDLQPVGSALGQTMLTSGEVDLAVSSWLTGTELPGLQVLPIASDAVTVIVNARNPITNVTLLQLRAIYQGHILGWKDLGGRSGEILVVSREDGSGTRALFEKNVMGDQRVTLTALVMPSEEAVRAYVASHTNAIGYASLVGAGGLGASVGVKTLAVEGGVPEIATLATSGYHLTRTIYLLARAPVKPSVQSFLTFVSRETGKQ